MMKVVLLVALLLAAQSCSARRLQEGTISSAARASSSGTDTAGAAGGGSIDGATKEIIAGASATASGNKAKTELEIVNESATSSGAVQTAGVAEGANGASLTSIGQVLNKPNAATSTAFTNGAAFGQGATLQSATATEANTLFGTVTSSSEVSVASDIAAYGSSFAQAISGYGGLFSQSQAIGFNREGRYGNALSLAATLGGYGPGKFSAATTAETKVDGTYATSTGTALFTAPYGRADVFVQDSARPILTTLG